MGISDDKLANMFSDITRELGKIKTNTEHIEEHLTELKSQTKKNTGNITDLSCEANERKINLLTKSFFTLSIFTLLLFVLLLPQIANNLTKYPEIFSFLASVLPW